eukprot:CAMPEP_0169148230 /NCGR_PEP_ID=MMETSP1015-20121227/48733_1 /TAXON_ID=342587 /ORGANISM="Karlodinium micrum, Strain CCMP2283" /LENGTH=97 /DNA_ID=CAMNT_0009216671 /DNA_START=279 /DNA_END=572 /DNA_ORIENTATION=-
MGELLWGGLLQKEPEAGVSGKTCKSGRSGPRGDPCRDGPFDNGRARGREQLPPVAPTGGADLETACLRSAIKALKVPITSGGVNDLMGSTAVFVSIE